MSAKRVSQKNQVSSAADPVVSRPNIPAQYGVPKNNKGLLSWSHVIDRMTQALHYWICTVDVHCHPHITPVDGLWLDITLYFGGSPQTRRNKNLTANPAISVHLDGSLDVVILYGEAHLQTPDHSLAVQLAKASSQKYGYAPQPEQYETAGVHVFRPQTVIAWKQFPKDVTRWQFGDRG
jgi:hypothetical protein